MPDAVIVEVLRTPIGRASKGSLKDVRPDDLAAGVVRAMLARSGVDPALLEDHVLGCGYPERTQGFNIARRVNHLAGLPETTPGFTVSRFCGSSLQALRSAYHGVRAGEGEAYLVSGVESVSWVGRTLREEDKHPRLLPGGFADAYVAMGTTAENVAERCGVTRAEMDEYALRSHARAVSAWDSGAFDQECVPVALADGTQVSTDDGPRRNTSLQTLAGLQTPFKQDGTVTAGNSCSLNDGAASLLLMSAARAEREGLAARARIVSTAVSALDPRLMGLGPVEAGRLALSRAGLTAADLDAVEINEAFAAQVLPSARELGVDVDEQLNLLGGAIALGHPFGMTGVRIVGTLLSVLDQRNGRYGMAALCIGGGQGLAVVIERTN